MPIYEYKCVKCNQVDEVWQKISDPAPQGCSVCGAQVEKLMSMTSFALKGSGWYTTDYKRAAGAGASKGAETSVGAEAGASKAVGW